MKFSKRHFAVLGVFLGITGIVSCNSQNTRVSEQPTVENTKSDTCVIPEMKGYDAQKSPTTKHPGNLDTDRAAADCTNPETQGYDKES